LELSRRKVGEEGMAAAVVAVAAVVEVAVDKGVDDQVMSPAQCRYPLECPTLSEEDRL
jgi:hypothetical protein